MFLLEITLQALGRNICLKNFVQIQKRKVDGATQRVGRRTDDGENNDGCGDLCMNGKI